MPPLSQRRSETGQLLAGGRHEQHAGTLPVRPPSRLAQRWQDAATGEHGDLLDLIGLALGLVDFADVAEEARAYLSLPRPDPAPLPNKLPHAASGSTEAARHLAAITFPEALRRLYIIRDNDPAGDWARDNLTERAARAGIEVIALSPTLGDFNEDLCAHGVDALQALMRQQLAPQDVARFLDLAA